MACSTCDGCGKVTLEGESYQGVIDKDGTRPAWVGLTERIPALPCPKCSGTGKRKYKRKAKEA